jgi:hypothetical protein
MSLATTLMAVGIPAEQANRLGYEDRVPLDGNGTTQGSATELMATQTNVALGTSVGDTAFRLPAEAEYFQEYFLLNTTAETALIFPPVGDTIDANAVNAAVEIETDLARVFMRVEEGRWVSFPAGEGGGGIESIVAGAGISVDNTDPDNPIVSNTGVISVTAGNNVSITGTAQNPIINASASGTGTVETVAVASANGFAGTSNADPADPILTLSTTVTGLLEGNGTAAAAAPQTGTGDVVRATGGNASATVATATGSTTARSLAARFAEVFDVKDYGAVGDGVADDSGAIQDAIDACYATAAGGSVYLPRGEYLIGAQVSIPKTTGKSCHFYGDGVGATEIVVGAALGTATGALYIGSASAGGGCGIRISDFTISGPNTKKGIYIENANILRVDRVKFIGLDIGLQNVTSYFVQIADSEFNDLVSYGYVSLTTNHALELSGCGFYNIDGQCILFDGATASRNIKIWGNDFEVCGTVIQFNPGVNSLEFVGNWVEQAANAIWSFGASSTGVIIEGNELSQSANTALDNLTSGRFANNALFTQVVSAGTAGVAFQDGGGNFNVGSSTLPTLAVRFNSTGSITAIGLNVVRSGTSANLIVNEQSTGFNAGVAYQSAGVTKWEMGKDAADNFFYYDNVGARNVMAIAAGGDMTLMPAGGNVASAGAIRSTGTAGVGYATGAGGAVTQITSRTTGVTLNKITGAITLFSAAGSATYASFTVTNSTVAATDTVIVSQKSGTDLYEMAVTAVAAGSFRISFHTTGGTTVEQPVFNFAVIKAVAA